VECSSAVAAVSYCNRCDCGAGECHHEIAVPMCNNHLEKWSSPADPESVSLMPSDKTYPSRQGRPSVPTIALTSLLYYVSGSGQAEGSSVL